MDDRGGGHFREASPVEQVGRGLSDVPLSGLQELSQSVVTTPCMPLWIVRHALLFVHRLEDSH